MYTISTINDVNREADGRVSIEIIYTGDSKENPISFKYYINSNNPDWLRGQAMNQLAILNSDITAKNLFIKGMVLDTTTPLPVVPLTQAEIDRKTFSDDYQTFKSMQVAIVNGFMKSTDIIFTNVSNKLKAEFKIEYISLIS